MSGPYSPSEPGFGGNIAYQATEHWAIDGAVTCFPRHKDDVVNGGRKVLALAGVKAGIHRERLGLFGKIRAGAIRFGEGRQRPNTVCILIFPPPEGCYISETRFAVDVGGVLEFDLSRATALRVDVGDTVIRASKDSSLFGTQDRVTHNPQVSGGLVWRLLR